MIVKICSRLMFALCSQYTFDLFVFSFAPLFYSVSLNLSVKSSYTAALAYQIPGFYLSQKCTILSPMVPVISGILAIFDHHMHINFVLYAYMKDIHFLLIKIRF